VTAILACSVQHNLDLPILRMAMWCPGIRMNVRTAASRVGWGAETVMRGPR
jgi:hypothetical protein